MRLPHLQEQIRNDRINNKIDWVRHATYFSNYSKYAPTMLIAMTDFQYAHIKKSNYYIAK